MQRRGSDLGSWNKPWQFSLRVFIVWTMLCGLFVSVLMWTSPVVAMICSILVSFLIVLAGFYLQTRLALHGASVLVLSLASLVALRFTPATHEQSACLLCGKYRSVRTNLGILWDERQAASDLSAWYERVRLPDHVHCWSFVSSTRQEWGGKVRNFDSFAGQWQWLRHLREVEPMLDRCTLEDLASQYRRLVDEFVAAGQTPGAYARFAEQCETLLPVDEVFAER